FAIASLLLCFPTRRSSDLTVHWTYRDHHGRIIGAVWVEPVDCPGCGHTLDVGRAQLASGMARWAQRYASQQPVEERYAYEFEERSEEHTSELQSRENLVCR